jgi:hypothetical protein
VGGPIPICGAGARGSVTEAQAASIDIRASAEQKLRPVFDMTTCEVRKCCPKK